MSHCGTGVTQALQCLGRVSLAHRPGMTIVHDGPHHLFAHLETSALISSGSQSFQLWDPHFYQVDLLFELGCQGHMIIQSHTKVHTDIKVWPFSASWRLVSSGGDLGEKCLLTVDCQFVDSAPR